MNPDAANAAQRGPQKPPTRYFKTIGRSPFHMGVLHAKRTLIAEALRATNGNRTQAARQLGIQRTYLCRLVRELQP